ncbi:hypothetical protein GCM10027168_17170 [Streptomyces capparidis]
MTHNHAHSLPDTLPDPRSDEDTFVVPEDWHRRLHPRRGGVLGLAAEPDPTAPATVREQEAKAKKTLKRLLDEDGSAAPELARAVWAHQAGTADPLGAAVIGAVTGIRWSDSRTPRDVALITDAWAAEHGLAFAARATAELERVWASHRVRFLHPPGAWGVANCAKQIPHRTRALLAAAGEREYREAVEALEEARAGGPEPLRLVTAYLAPTRTEWVDEIVSAPLPGDSDHYSSMLLWSLTDARQVAQFRKHRRYPMVAIRRAVHALTEAVGPALAPVLADLYDEDPRDGAEILSVLAALPTDEAFRLLLERAERPGASAYLAEAMRRYPRRALRVLGSAAAPGPSSREAALAYRLLRDHARAHGAAVPAEVAGRHEAARVPDAPAEALPRLLVEPPWTRERKGEEPVVVPGLTAPEERAVVWAPGEREEWSAAPVEWWDKADWDWARTVERHLAGELVMTQQARLLCEGPEELVRPLLPGMPVGGRWYDGLPRRVAARFGADALPKLMEVAREDPAEHGEALLPFFAPETAALMADWLVRLKRARDTAAAWLLRHPAPAARALVPAALGKAGRKRAAAEAALRLLAEHGRADEVRDAARFHGERAEAGIEALLSEDPLDRLPAKIPVVELDFRLLPQVLLRDRRAALPETAVRHVVTMLAMCTADQAYPGVAVVEELCDPASLDAFGWALFQQVGKEAGWILPALGRIGGDTTARGLAPLIRAWPGENAHAKAVAGLDALVAIGTDQALVLLNGIAQRVKFKAIKARAQERIEALAADLGLTADQLADRLVPDFGLDRDGSLTLDYGPRSFTAGFDEQLKPYVVDGTGKRLKNLPKPGVKDDGELAPAAYARFAALKKDVRTTAADQIRRLEQAMLRQRRWSLAEFRTHLADHPLLWHIARRLVWLTDEGVSFRIAEDRTLADADDGTLTLPETAVVRVAHPLHLDGTLEGWAEVFADYELLQPFPQLGRPVHTLTDDERSSTGLTRFQGATVPTVKLRGLERRGWQDGPALDNGIQGWLTKAVAPDRWVVLGLDPGIAIGTLDLWPEQTLRHVWIDDRPDGHWTPRGALRFAELDPVAASELVADLTDLTAQPA